MALLFAVAAGTMSASYAICMRLGAGAISPALGALIVSAIALPFTVAVFIAMRMTAPGLTFTIRGGVLMVLAGIAAASTTVFALLAYSRGFQLSSSPVVTATQMSVVLLVGFVGLREPLGAGRLIGLGLIALGIVLLQRAGA
jgi:uncharacterized membrane protein